MQLKYTKNKQEVYNNCNQCQEEIPHIHFYFKNNDGPKLSKEELKEIVFKEREEYHNNYGKDGFLSERTYADDYLSESSINDEVENRFQYQNVKLKIDKVVTINVLTIEENYEFLI